MVVIPGEIPAGMRRSWVQAPILQDQAGCTLWGFALHLLPLRSQNPDLILHPPELLSTLGTLSTTARGFGGTPPAPQTPPILMHINVGVCVCVGGVHASIPYHPPPAFRLGAPPKRRGRRDEDGGTVATAMVGHPGGFLPTHVSPP